MVIRREQDREVSTIKSENLGGVQLLERTELNTNEETKAKSTTSEAYAAERERMQRNLDKLLNYDRYSEQNSGSVLVEDAPKVEEKPVETAQCDEDIKPTSTTMQFGDDNLDQIYKDMNKAEEQSSESYRLNKKGKLVVALYSIFVAVMLAIIMLNTGVLTALSKSSAEKTAMLSERVAQYNALYNDVTTVSSDEFVMNAAENTYGMIKGN